MDVLRGPGVHLRDIAFGQEAQARTCGLLERYKIRYVYHESTGGHEWVNWRRHLEDFAPRLFQPAK